MKLADGIGTSISLVRAARVLVWAIVGLLLLARRGTSRVRPT
jgi:hypothetical protein